ncbi:MAG: hypothetical protein M3232_00845 [Thermoproteota archaeon]|nr:hypothetical protein [Thermoproteota archaeon]
MTFSVFVPRGTLVGVNGSKESFSNLQIIWIAIGFAVSLAIFLVVPFPYFFGVMMIVFLGILYAVRAWAMMKIRHTGTSYFNESISDYILGFNHGNALNFYCMNCGYI